MTWILKNLGKDGKSFSDVFAPFGAIATAGANVRLKHYQFQKALRSNLLVVALVLDTASFGLAEAEWISKGTGWRRDPGGWLEWAKKAVEGSGRLAHRWTAIPSKWEPEWGPSGGGNNIAEKSFLFEGTTKSGTLNGVLRGPR